MSGDPSESNPSWGDSLTALTALTGSDLRVYQTGLAPTSQSSQSSGSTPREAAPTDSVPLPRSSPERSESTVEALGVVELPGWVETLRARQERQRETREAFRARRDAGLQERHRTRLARAISRVEVNEQDQPHRPEEKR